MCVNSVSMPKFGFAGYSTNPVCDKTSEKPMFEFKNGASFDLDYDLDLDRDLDMDLDCDLDLDRDLDLDFDMDM